MKIEQSCVNEMISSGSIRITEFDHDEIGDNHLFTSIETPMRKDAFALSDHEKNKGLLIILVRSCIPSDWTSVTTASEALQRG